MAMMAGCSRIDEMEERAEKVSKTFYARMEDSPATKTVLGTKDENGIRNLLWLPEDSIGIAPASGGSLDVFANKSTESSVEAIFEGKTELASSYYAFYPYDEKTTVSADAISFTLDNEQTYKAGSFDQGAFPMIARSSDTDENGLNFLNLCGVLELNLTGEEIITSITFSSANKVSGEFSVSTDYAEYPEIAAGPSTSTTVKLDCGEGVQLNATEPTPFYFVLPPGEYGAFTLMFRTSDGKRMFKQGKKPLTLKRSVITAAGALEYVETVEIDLSLRGTSNCYVVSDANLYCFNASVIGNGTYGIIPDGSFHTEDPGIAPVSVEVIWESGPADAKVEKGDLLSEVTLKDGYVHFISTGEEGNALIAAKDADGNILWSWHIWMTDQPLDQTYLNSAGTFVVQDRNLGATRADRGTGDQWKEAKGIMYEWGRKDPFIFDDVDGKIVGTRNSNRITIAESISDPTCFAGGSNGWESSGSKASLWLPSKKTIYDPCPVGYKVARKEIWADFSKTGSNVQNNVDEFNVSGSHNNGWDFYYDGTNTTYIPANDAVNYYYQYDHRNNIGDLWSSDATSGTKAYRWNYTYSDASNCGMQILYSEITSHAMSLRCMKDETHVDLAFPMVEMVGAKDVTTESVRILFNITSEGLAEVTEAGVIYSTTPGVSSGNGTKVTRTGEENIVEVTGLTEGTKYYAVAYATNSYGTTYSKEIVFYTEFVNCTNLSKYGTSNCYIVTKPGAYTFDAIVKGNGNESICNDEALRLGFSAIVLWETNNTDSFIEVEEIIRNVTYDAGYVRFDATGVPGNALIAVKDSSGTILWSWHIWSCDFDPYATANTYISGAVLMDRNLGALNVEKNDVRSYGLFYQWGRKDPSVGPLGRNGNYFAVTAPADAINYVSATTSNNTLTFTVNNPTTVIDGSTWNNEDYLWSSEKTIYDPCPIGWRIPDKSAWEGVSTSDYMINEPYSVPAAYCPVIGITEGYAYVQYSSDWLHIWSTSRSEYFASNGNSPSNDIFSARDVDNQMSVRCMREHAINVVLETSPATQITKTSAVIHGSMGYLGDVYLDDMGFVWSTDEMPVLSSSKETVEIKEGEFSCTLTGLSPATTYYVRTFATEGNITIYGPVVSFTTQLSAGNEGIPEDDDYEWN